MLNRRHHRPLRTGRGSSSAEIRILRLELPHFSLSTPLSIAGPRVSQVSLRDPVEATCCVELGGEFQGKGFVMDEAVLACRTDGLLVKLRGVAVPCFNPCQLRGHQRGTVLEILRTVPSPELEHLKMAGRDVDVLPPVIA